MDKPPHRPKAGTTTSTTQAPPSKPTGASKGARSRFLSRWKKRQGTQDDASGGVPAARAAAGEQEAARAAAAAPRSWAHDGRQRGRTPPPRRTGDSPRRQSTPPRQPDRSRSPDGRKGQGRDRSGSRDQDRRGTSFRDGHEEVRFQPDRPAAGTLAAARGAKGKGNGKAQRPFRQVRRPTPRPERR